MSPNRVFKIITFSDITIDKINVPDGYIYDTVHNNTYYCDVCNKWLSISCVQSHCIGKKHLKLLDGRTDHTIYYTSPAPTEQEKISKLIKNTAVNAVDNVKKRVREKYYSNEERYRRITGLDLFDGISSVEKLIEHQGMILEQMNLPDLDVGYGDGDSCCPYGCANHSYQRENFMLSRVHGLKIAMHILITNFGKNIAMEDTSGWATPIVPGVAEKVYYYEDPCWSKEYYDETIAIEDTAETKRTEERRAAYAAATNAARTRVAAKKAEARVEMVAATAMVEEAEAAKKTEDAAKVTVIKNDNR